jgi:hypothetical protein
MFPGPSKHFLPFSFTTLSSLLRTVKIYFIQGLLEVHKLIALDEAGV